VVHRPKPWWGVELRQNNPMYLARWVIDPPKPLAMSLLANCVSTRTRRAREKASCPSPKVLNQSNTLYWRSREVLMSFTQGFQSVRRPTSYLQPRLLVNITPYTEWPTLSILVPLTLLFFFNYRWS